MPAITLAEKFVTNFKQLEPEYNEGTPAKVAQIIAQTCTEYLLAHVTVYTVYAGETPAGVPEAGSGQHKISGAVTPVLWPGSYEAWLDNLGSNIAAGFLTLPGPPVTPQAPHLSLGVPVTALSKFVPQTTVKEAIESNLNNNPQLAFWTKISEGIFTMINTQVSLPFNAGITGTGVATVIKLVLV